MTVIGTATIEVVADASKFGPDAEKQIGGPLKSLAAGAASAFAAVKVKDLFTGFIEEAREAEKVGRLTNAVIESTGGVANVSAEDLDKLATRLSGIAAVDDEVIASGANLLLTFTNIRNEVGKGNDIFDQATEAALNISAAMGTDLQGNITLVGKALNDPVKGMAALSRAGVQLTEDQKTQIRSFVAVGDTISAQKVLLKELETQFGGAAAAAADPAAKLGIAWGNLQEQIGLQLLPVMDKLVGILGEGIELFAGLPGPVQLGTVSLLALAAVSGPLLTIGGNLRTIYDGAASLPGKFSDAATSMKNMGTSGLLLGGVVGIIAGIGIAALSTAESLDKKLNRVIDELAGLTDNELVDAFEAGGSTLQDFERIADQNLGTAIRLRDELKRQGETTTDLDSVIKDHTEAQKNAARGTDLATEAVQDEDAAMVGLTDTVDEATKKLNEYLDVTLEAFSANLDYEGQVNNVEDALATLNEKTAEVVKTKGRDKEATEAQERATLDAAEAILGLGNKAVKAAEQQAALSGKTLDAGEKAEIQRKELEKVATTLDPASPLYRRLIEYIYALAAIPKTVKTTIEQTYVSRGNDGSNVVRRHTGGVITSAMPSWPSLRDDERPAILQVGEQVLPRGSVNNIGGGGGGITLAAGAVQVSVMDPSRLAASLNVEGAVGRALTTAVRLRPVG